MQRVLIPWSRIHTPGISALVLVDDVHTADPIVTVPHAAVDELIAAFAAFCGSWQQGDRHGCALVAPLLTRHGVAALPL
jgi:hypothetical protein